MFDPSKYTVPTARPIPVLLLLDTSGSMWGDNIDTLNSAVRQMLASFSKEEGREIEVLVSIITFGSRVERLQPFTPASAIEFRDLTADGMTPLGEALRLAKDMIEDREETPGRAYRPTVVLVSDGQPNDSWEEPLRRFISEGRSSKCFRWAMAIGADADRDVLRQFTEGMQEPLFEAEQASEIHKFFKLVTMSVTARMKTANPNLAPDLRASMEGSGAPASVPSFKPEGQLPGSMPSGGAAGASPADEEEDNYYS